mmetsp:Transcript_8035/g.19602  ORF Transcript_8035/g.19602 Transcript_8035/m.19602 type:complete len:230 (+) Transcript_8035:132-821(+)
MREVVSKPMNPGSPVGFCVLRVPFFLEPEYPTDESFGETNRVRLVRKWGGQANWQVQKARHGLQERGLQVGIKHFNLDRVASSTLASHRIVQWMTKKHGITAAESLYNDLNFRHFEQGEKLNHRTMLVAAAEKAGADPVEAEAFLASNDGFAQIEAAQQYLRKMGVNSIPTFILGGKKMVSGAMHGAELVAHLRQFEKEGNAGNSVFGEILGIPEQVLQQTLPFEALSH